MTVKRAEALVAQPLTAITVLLFYKAYTAFAAFRAGPAHLLTAQAITAECVALLIVSYFALRKKVVALWVLAVSMWLQALFTAVMVFVPPHDSNWLRAMGFVLTIYFIIGGRVLVMREWAGTPNQAL